jgi:hypothetical protein
MLSIRKKDGNFKKEKPKMKKKKLLLTKSQDPGNFFLKSSSQGFFLLATGVLPGLVPGVRYRGCVGHALLLQQEELLGAGPLHSTLHSQILQGRTSQKFSPMLWIRDIYPGYRIRIFSLPDPCSKRFPDPHPHQRI